MWIVNQWMRKFDKISERQQRKDITITIIIKPQKVNGITEHGYRQQERKKIEEISSRIETEREHVKKREKWDYQIFIKSMDSLLAAHEQAE